MSEEFEIEIHSLFTSSLTFTQTDTGKFVAVFLFSKKKVLEG
jgi:hypothetical protein